MAESRTSSFSWLIELLPTSRPLRVLDIGCGECLEGEALLAVGVELTGVDFDEAAIAAARDRIPDGRFLCADAAGLTADGSAPFDIALFRRPDIAAQPARWNQILARAPGWLRPGGQILLTTPGPQEAGLAKKWLEETGISDPTILPLEEQSEAFLVSGTAAAALKLDRKPAKPINVIVWDEEGSEGAQFCDPKTGLCSPVQENIGV